MLESISLYGNLEISFHGKIANSEYCLVKVAPFSLQLYLEQAFKFRLIKYSEYY